MFPAKQNPDKSKDKTRPGGHMSTSAFSRGMIARRETLRDLLVVLSFGFWALLLGLAPVLGAALLAGQ